MSCFSRARYQTPFYSEVSAARIVTARRVMGSPAVAHHKWPCSSLNTMVRFEKLMLFLFGISVFQCLSN